MYRVRRRRALLLAAAALASALGGCGVVAHLFVSSVRGQIPRGPAHSATGHRVHAPTVWWPPQGQAAFVLGRGRPAASPHQRPAPIASLAKVMTAYLTLQRYPLSGTQAGFTVTISAADAQVEADDVSEGQSGVSVRVGERLTERQLLEALLIPSGNNIAALLANGVAGSEPGFVADMNAEARALGMHHTVYTDPSGFDPGTVSTAADQLRIFRQAMRFLVFRQIVSMPSITLPVAGTLRNFNPLVSEGYAGKTGSDSAAGGCLAFFTRLVLHGRKLTAAGVVMGQGAGNSTSEILAAAGAAAQQLMAANAPSLETTTHWRRQP